MIRRSTAIALAALLLSFLMHVFGLGLTWQGMPEPSRSVAGNEALEVSTTFEDLVESRTEPVPPEPPVEPRPEPEQAEVPTSQARVASANPQQTATPDTGTVKAVEPGTIEPANPDRIGTPDAELMEPSGGAEQAKPVTSPVAPAPVAQQTARAVIAAPPKSPSRPADPTAPVSAPSSIPVIPPHEDTTEDQVTDSPEGSDLAVVASLRPRRPASDTTEDVAAGTALAQPSQTIESPLAAYMRDGTDLTVRQSRGSISGGLGFEVARGPGNSDTTNYAGLVLVHLNRAPVVPVSGRGAARVFFVINPDGSLASVDVFDSVGSKDIIRAAKEQIRVAAPFPPPPQGSSRSLSFIYRVR